MLKHLVAYCMCMQFHPSWIVHRIQNITEAVNNILLKETKGCHSYRPHKKLYGITALPELYPHFHVIQDLGLAAYVY